MSGKKNENDINDNKVLDERLGIDNSSDTLVNIDRKDLEEIADRELGMSELDNLDNLSDIFDKYNIDTEDLDKIADNEERNKEGNKKIGQKGILKKDLEDVLNKQDDIIGILKEETNKKNVLKKDIEEVESLGEEIRKELDGIESMSKKEIIKFYDNKVVKYLTKIYDMDRLSTDLKHNPNEKEEFIRNYFELKEMREKVDSIEKSRNDIKNRKKSKVNIVKRLKQRKEINKEVEEKSKEIIKLNLEIASRAYKSPNMPYNIKYHMFKLQGDIGNLRNVNGKKNNITKIKSRLKKFLTRNKGKNKNSKDDRGM